MFRYLGSVKYDISSKQVILNDTRIDDDSENAVVSGLLTGIGTLQPSQEPI